MNDKTHETNLIVCQCKHCAGEIEFHSSRSGEPVSCPHCSNETLLTLPPSETIPPILPTNPPAAPTPELNWSGSENSVVEIQLTSGFTIKVKGIKLYSAAELDSIAAEKKRIVDLFDEAKSPYSFIGGMTWVVFMSTVTGMLEQHKTNEAARKSIGLIRQIAEREKKLRDNSKFFHVGVIDEIANAVPSLWRVPVLAGFVHSGDEFVSVMDDKDESRSIRWSSVESYKYHANISE